jgi:hypothetical protein
MDNDFGAYVQHWIAITKIIPLIEKREIRAKAELLRLLFVQRSLSNWPKWRMLPEYRSWLQTIGEYVFLIRSESPGWYLKSAYFWKLHDEYKDLSDSDDIAWVAANNPEPEICETDIVCRFRALNGSVIRYLLTRPDGKYVALALERVLSFSRGFEEVDILRERLKEIFDYSRKKISKYAEDDAENIKSDLVAMNECLRNVANVNDDYRSKRALQIFELIFGQYLKPPIVSIRPRELQQVNAGSANEDHLSEEIETLAFLLFHEYDLELGDLLTAWRTLNRYIPSITDQGLSAKAKFLRLVSLKRALRFGCKNSREVPELAEIMQESGFGIMNRGGVQNELWKLVDEYRILPIADDIAWEACNDFPQYDEDVQVINSEFDIQLHELSDTMGRYLLLFPDGKNAPVALERIVAFFRICTEEDPLIPPPYGVLDASRSELAAFKNKLKDIIVNNRTKRATNALSAFDGFERYLQKYRRPPD